MIVAHVDHQLAPGSADRALEAERRALSLIEQRRPGCTGAAARFVALRTSVQTAPQAPRSMAEDHGIEANARNQRYQLLEQCREQHNCSLILTAHHASDQLETMLLRLSQGSGLFGLSAINKQRGRLWRPLLRTRQNHGPTSGDLREILGQESITWVEDPTNQDRRHLRNRARNELLPLLVAQREIADDAALHADRLAGSALRVRRLLKQKLDARFGFQTTDRGASLDFDQFLQADTAVRELALDALHRSAGLHYPASAAAKRELHRQIAAHTQPSRSPKRSSSTGRGFGCSCGDGWCWRVRRASHHGRSRSLLTLAQSEPSKEPGVPPFAYTLSIPGITPVPELSCSLEASRARAESWMTLRWHNRVALFVPNLQANVTVRNRLPGDTVYPFGARSTRVKLKKLLIDRKIPQEQRDALPIVCVDDEIAWIAGITTAEPFRIPSTTDTTDQSLVTLRLQPLPQPSHAQLANPFRFNAS